MTEIAAAFERTNLVLSPLRQCLPRSLALAMRLARLGANIDLVIGVANNPFSAHAWVQHRHIVLNDRLEKVQGYGLYGSGRKVAFTRNRKLVDLKPVEAVLCEGSGLQANLYQLLRTAGVPIHAFRKSDQVADKPVIRPAFGRRAMHAMA